jgi:hypothetical protein
MKKYVSKNRMYNVEENESADQILCMMEGSGCLSDSLKTRISNIVLWIVTNHRGHEDGIRESIDKLEIEMNWISIFSKDFISKLHFSLHDALNFQTRNDK